MTSLDLQSRLSQLRGADDLRALFADLSYEVDFAPVFLPRETKADLAAAEALAAPPELLAQFDEFVIIYAPLLNWKTALSSQRLLISRLIQDFPFALWVFSDEGGQNWHLVNVKRGAGGGQSAMGRHVLRRFSFARGQNAGRTSVERLSQIDLANFIGTELEVQTRHDAAFDVEAVTRDFFRDYKQVFEDVETRVALKDGIERRAWTQRLFNRLMFLRFLGRKGWLQFEGDPDYLRALYRAAERDGESLLNDRLFYAFFYGLGIAAHDGAASDAQIHNRDYLVGRRGQVPYLNGGLFEQLENDDTQTAATLPNAAFAGILDLFDRYNFTITESTPFDQEVGIDPEMLGKVFEELVTGRHESGSYYTPRGIVSFMAREAMKGYLASSSVPAETLAALVDESEVRVSIVQARELLTLVENITVCDPACGSGAYLLGAMQELLRLYFLLEVTGKARTPRSEYDRKLHIIAHNLYGVDLDPFAVGIAMLRLWLSLVIEYEGETPPPLPNLKYKIECGDSLAAPLGGQMSLDQNTVDEFNDKKRLFVRAQGAEKRELETAIEQLRAELKQWSQSDQGFDWRIEFAEIFSPTPTSNPKSEIRNPKSESGFDIVLANPPFVTNGLIPPDYKRRMTANLGAANTSNTMDLYCYFYLRAFELLRAGGELAFISPNKWFRAAYGAKLRAFFAAHAHVQTIVDFGELPVFQNAATFPMVFTANKTQTRGATNFTQVKTLVEPYPDVLALVKRDGALLPDTAIQGDNWNLSDAQTFARLETMRKSGVPLGEYVKGQIFYGVKTGFNTAFVIDGATRLNLVKADAKSAELIKPMAKGDDVRRWRIEDRDRFLIVTKIGVPIKEYPAIFAHLKQWQPQLERRTDQGNHWWELRACAYYDVFEKPKIHYPEISGTSRFTLDTTKITPLKTVFTIDSEDLYLLGVLNSDSAWGFLKKICSVLGDEERGGRLLMSTVSVEQLPIPNASASDRDAIAGLVEACLAKRGRDCDDEEREINVRVAALYGL